MMSSKNIIPVVTDGSGPTYYWNDRARSLWRCQLVAQINGRRAAGVNSGLGRVP